jgi:glycosyltransferase involved in cell wall biosynthesis
MPKLLLRIDKFSSLICNLMLLAVVILASVIRRVWYFIFNRKPSDLSRIVFLSSEGKKVAPTRVRSYHFAESMQLQGMTDAFVFAYWDTYRQLSHFPFPFRHIWEMEKFFVNLATLLHLLFKGPLIIIEQRPNYGFIVPLYLKLLNGSRVFMDIDDWILDYLTLNPMIRLEVRHMLPLFGLYCDTCIVSSRRLRQRLSRHFKHIHLLPTYVDHHRFTAPSRHEKKGPVFFSWVGTIFQNFTRDNVLFMIKAFSMACDHLNDQENIQLEIVGGGDYYDAVKAQVLTRFKRYPIRMTPWLDPDAMPDYIRSIDVGLYCLIDPSLFQESKSPTKIFEYYACAKPVISTSFGEAKYFVEQEQTGILADTLEEYANAIVRLFQESELRLSMGQKGRLLVESKYNMNAACKTLKNIVLPGSTFNKEH